MEREEFEHLEAEAEKFKKQQEQAKEDSHTFNPLKKVEAHLRHRKAASEGKNIQRQKDIELKFVQGQAEKMNRFFDWLSENQQSYESWIFESFGSLKNFEATVLSIRGSTGVDPDAPAADTSYFDHADFLKKNIEKFSVWVHRTFPDYWIGFYDSVQNKKYYTPPSNQPLKSSRRQDSGYGGYGGYSQQGGSFNDSSRTPRG